MSHQVEHSGSESWRDEATETRTSPFYSAVTRAAFLRVFLRTATPSSSPDLSTAGFTVAPRIMRPCFATLTG